MPKSRQIACLYVEESVCLRPAVYGKAHTTAILASSVAAQLVGQLDLAIAAPAVRLRFRVRHGPSRKQAQLAWNRGKLKETRCAKVVYGKRPSN